MDIIYLGIVAVFFVLTWGLMKMCDSLGEHKSGERP
jgi:hypothetical protein